MRAATGCLSARHATAAKPSPRQSKNTIGAGLAAIRSTGEGRESVGESGKEIMANSRKARHKPGTPLFRLARIRLTSCYWQACPNANRPLAMMELFS
jgi:hypothetical protein